MSLVLNALLCSNKFYCPLDQSGVPTAGEANPANLIWKEDVTVSLFFHPFSSMLLTPPPVPMSILYSPQFRLHQETKMDLKSTSMISRKNRGL